MKYLEISVGKSLDPNTCSEWRKCDAKVSLEDGENAFEVFKKVQAEIDSWLPNPFKQPEMKFPLTTSEVVIGMGPAINACKTLAELETFQLLVKKQPQFQEAYNNKMRELAR